MPSEYAMRRFHSSLLLSLLRKNRPQVATQPIAMSSFIDNSKKSKESYHAHFDCFSGCAGDMMLASCLSASTSQSPQDFLMQIENDLKRGIPEIENEFSLHVSKVWRGGMGSIAALKVDVESVYDHKAAPVPQADREKIRVDEASKHEHDHKHDDSHAHGHGHSHEEETKQTSIRKKASSDHNHSHDHEKEESGKNTKEHDGHDHSPSHAHDKSHNHSHAHSHEHKHAHAHGHDHDNDHDPQKEKKTQHSPPKNEEHHDVEESKTDVAESHGHDHSHPHGHGHSHGHDHGHGHSHSNSGDGPLRNLPQIQKMLEESDRRFIPSKVAKLAIQTFTELAIAEAFTHGASSRNLVHFHEVGAIDSIVDVVGTLLALHHLSVDTVSCSRLPMGEGTVWTDHGQLPVPAFATMRLLIGMKTCEGPGEKMGIVTGELVTPTAAALLRVLTGVADAKNNDGKTEVRIGRTPAFTPISVGIGAGTKDFVKFPNIIRLIIGKDLLDDVGGRVKKSSDGVPLSKAYATEPAVELSEDLPTPSIDAKQEDLSSELHNANLPADTEIKSGSDLKWNIDKVNLLQANLDDITAEVLSYAIDLLLKSGAIDAWVEPIVMKKGRSAHKLNCLFRSEDKIEGKLMEIMFRHTTTLGIRIQRDVERASLRRKMIQVQTMYGVGNEEALDGVVNVKLGLLENKVISVKAEFEDCKRISEATGVPLKTIADDATRRAQNHAQGNSIK